MARGTVVIKSKTGPALAISAWLAESGPNVTGGYGGWDTVSRPHRVAITQWRGREPIQMDLPIIIDGYDGSEIGTGIGSRRLRDSIELVITKLERMALPPSTNKFPPQIKLVGSSTNLVPHDDLTWVITAIAWGAALRNDDGNRVRQEATVTLLSYVGVEKLKLSAAKKIRQKAGRG